MKSLLTLVGTKWLGEEIKQLMASLPAGEQLFLVRDFGNAFDVNAIKVFARSKHIGFVKGTEAARLAPRMDKLPRASLLGSLAFDGSQWPLIEVEDEK